MHGTTWFYRATTFLSKIDHEQICRNRGLSIQAVLHSVDTQLHDLYEQKWQTKLNTDIAVRGPEAGGNKLRTYRKFKQQYTTEPYVNIIIAKKNIDRLMQNLGAVLHRLKLKHVDMV